MGGISRTVRYKGNRMDIGGHRFFSKSDRVMNWWMEVMPVVTGAGATEPEVTQSRSNLPAPDPRGAGLRRGARGGTRRPRDADSQPEIAHLLSPTVLRLPDPPERRYAEAARARANREDRRELRPERGAADQTGSHARTISDQPLRPRTVSDVFQVVYGKGLGRSLRSDQRRVGRAAHQRPFRGERHSTLFERRVGE